MSTQTTLQSALVCPLVFNERFIGTIAVYHTDDRRLHRRSPPPARSHLGAGRRGHLQLDRVRADAGRLADRSADGAAEHAVHVHAPDARAGARQPPQVGSVAARHGPRQLQGNQRHLRPPRRRPRAARSGRRPARRRSGPYDICVRYAGDEFIVVLSGCGGDEAERKRLELQRAVDTLQFEAAPRQGRCRWRSASARPIFPHDGDSYETLLATADSRMYRDKTRRKRHGTPDVERPRPTTPPGRRTATSSDRRSESCSR